MKSKIIFLLAFVLVCIAFTGCTKEPDQNTIVKPEKSNEKQQMEKLELNKLTKLEGKGTVKGWINENELLTVSSTRLQDKDAAGRYKWLELKKVNYSTLEVNKFIENQFYEIALSPDGTKAAYRKSEATNDIMGIIDTSSGKEISLGNFSTPGSITWSNNSKLFSSLVKDGIAICDTDTKKSKQYNISNLRNISGYGDVMISDDAKHAFLALHSGLYLVDLSSLPKDISCLEPYKISNGTVSSYTFINNSEVLFVGAKGEFPALYYYNLNTREKKEILESVSSFILSNSKSHIAYTIGSTLYVGALTDYKIANASTVFKGNIAARMWWNKDNMKFVFSGSEQGDGNFKQYVAELK
jgi:hypothetical protein